MPHEILPPIVKDCTGMRSPPTAGGESSCGCGPTPAQDVVPERIRNGLMSAIRRRFVPALVGRLTEIVGIACRRAAVRAENMMRNNLLTICLTLGPIGVRQRLTRSGNLAAGDCDAIQHLVHSRRPSRRFSGEQSRNHSESAIRRCFVPSLFQTLTGRWIFCVPRPICETERRRRQRPTKPQIVA